MATTAKCDVSKIQTRDIFDKTFTIVKNVTDNSKIRLVQVKQSGKQYICKLIDCGRNQDIQKVYNEYKLVRNNSVLLYHGLFYDKVAKQTMIIMEPLSITLNEYIQTRNKLNENQTKLIALDILKKLNVLHSNHYIHCDLKPENIMFRNRKYDNKINACTGWNIIDFGSILYINPDVGYIKSKYRGTFCWSAPEITYCKLTKNKKSNRFTYSADIWSFGLIILYLLFGKQPYQLSYDEINFNDDNKIEINWNNFYNKKLMRFSNDNTRTKNNKKNKFINNGEKYLQNYLVKLFYECKISQHLFDLLHNCLTFDSTKRLSCNDLLKHPWFTV